MNASHLAILKKIVNLPTAPFVEGSVFAEIRRFVAARPMLDARADRFGNLLVRYRPRGRAPMKGRPVLLAAHMDHPGFVVTRAMGKNLIEADFRGWVGSTYFHTGQSIRFHDGRKWIKASIEKIIQEPKKPSRSTAASFRDDHPPKSVIAKVAGPVPINSPGMWDLPDAEIRKNQIYARACDDVAGLAAVLCALDEICRKPIRATCYAFFTRAEEVGFAGALAAVDAKTVPRDALIVAVECSKAITGVNLGDGPVLRVGDRASIFTPAATAYCQVVAEKLAATDRTFRFQRKLMDGGTCESTAYCHFGYEATGLCLPLGNYHNMDTHHHRIGPEFIHLDDFANLVKWFVAILKSPVEMKYDGRHPGLDHRLKALLRQHRPHLQKTRASMTPS